MRRIWAIAKITLAEAMRTRVAVAFILLLAGMMTLLITTAKGDGTLSGKIQMFMSYSLDLTYFLLAILAVFLSCQTLAGEITSQRINSLISKPIARWQILLGKYLGVALLAGLLMSISAGTTYGIIKYRTTVQGLDKEEKFKLANQVLVARRNVLPPIPDVSKQVEELYERARKDGELPEDLPASQIRKMLSNQLILPTRTVSPRQSRSWTITGLTQPKSGDVVITLRFKYEPSHNTQAMPQFGLYGNTIVGRWIIGKPTSPNAYRWEGTKTYRTPHEINIPINAIEPDGTLMLTFVNLDPRDVSVHFPLKDGMEVLYRVGSFAPNFIRTTLAMFLPVLFLIAVALTAATFLSFPVASLVSLTIFFIGISSGFMVEAMGLDKSLEADATIWTIIQYVVGYAAINVVPNLNAGSLSSLMIDGREVSWTLVGLMTLKMVIIGAGIVGVVGIAIFQRRELGKLTI